VLLNWHLHWTLSIILFTVARHFGNSLQKRFCRQCLVFSTCVSYTTLVIFALNFWYNLWSLTANQECRICGFEMLVDIQRWKYITQNKNYAGHFMPWPVITLAIFPSCSWAFKQQVWYSNGWRTVIVVLNTNIWENMFGKFPSQRPVYIPDMCTVSCNQSIKCQVHWFEMSHMWTLCSVEHHLADRLRSCRLWMLVSVHGGVHYNLWQPTSELFHTTNPYPANVQDIVSSY